MEFGSILLEFEKRLTSITTRDDLENLRVEYLGKSGIVTKEMQKLATLSVEEKKSFGSLINQIKTNISEKLSEYKEILEAKALEQKLQNEYLDVTIPGRYRSKGSLHPITQTIESMVHIFSALGFKVKEGSSIENDWHNFTALNIPQNHPSRQMHDTFYVNKENFLLRTHTSPIQIRTMEENKPPIKIVAHGRVYRCDSDMTHTPMFHQIEGLYIDKDIHMGHLKSVITEFLHVFFENDKIKIRFRPSFFPFTEPSLEVDIGCSRKNGKLILGEGDDWLEVLGCGMVHPNVLRNCKIDPEIYQGFAFGMGVDRFAMLKYEIADLREFFSGDKRWLNHYNFSGIDIASLVGGLTK
jgi:phenylalanyl-tRNA synthetase alpha chain